MYPDTVNVLLPTGNDKTNKPYILTSIRNRITPNSRKVAEYSEKTHKPFYAAPDYYLVEVPETAKRYNLVKKKEFLKLSGFKTKSTLTSYKVKFQRDAPEETCIDIDELIQRFPKKKDMFNLTKYPKKQLDGVYIKAVKYLFFKLDFISSNRKFGTLGTEIPTVQQNVVNTVGDFVINAASDTDTDSVSDSDSLVTTIQFDSDSDTETVQKSSPKSPKKDIIPNSLKTEIIAKALPDCKKMQCQNCGNYVLGRDVYLATNHERVEIVACGCCVKKQHVEGDELAKLKGKLEYKRTHGTQSILCKVCNCNHVCQFDFHSGHNLAEANGGKTVIENLEMICAECNLAMSNKWSIDEFKEILKTTTNQFDTQEQLELWSNAICTLKDLRYFDKDKQKALLIAVKETLDKLLEFY